MVQGLPHIEGKQHVCEGCAFGKQHRLPFPKGVSWRAKEKLELIHTDVCGPMDTLSHAQNRYFILFIDDHTRMTWVYFMRQKSEVFMIFKKFKSLVEKQSGCFIKTLRSDRGKEYTSKEFHNFCEDEGVERQLTVRYTPQQNGVTERKNQTIVEMAKSMMHEKGLPKIFWAEAVYTAVYLSNRCPTTAIPNKTPFEAWSGRRPSVNHLKVFGSICYSQIPKQKRSKLDESSERCIFVGYSTMSKGYRLFNLQLGQVIISRDVQVDENALWNWEENKVEKKDILISTDKEDEIEPSTPDSSSSQPNEESSTDPTSSNSSSPSATPKSDLGGSLDDMKSTSGYCFSFGSAIFSWVSKKQQSVAQSSAEAEYISASVATSQAIWLRKILADLGHHQIEGTVLHCDNKSAIAMAKNPVHHNRTRHIALKHHFIRQAIEDKEIQLDSVQAPHDCDLSAIATLLHSLSCSLECLPWSPPPAPPEDIMDSRSYVPRSLTRTIKGLPLAIDEHNCVPHHCSVVAFPSHLLLSPVSPPATCRRQCLLLDDTHQVLEDMPVSDEVSYNSHISGYVYGGDVNISYSVFEEISYAHD
ncbi:hypothetical protein ZIOFF_013800 [Zingiber officinale]|uniref:Integrase catalytic domain-containing protein n=1 Tax=Zingiber officinale TaxID=94328 RepID=A0A8J5HZX5_ZINOF|nr:hypothetical protein ZIOFF_013800 [Zingiber officinale]